MEQKKIAVWYDEDDPETTFAAGIWGGISEGLLDDVMRQLAEDYTDYFDQGSGIYEVGIGGYNEPEYWEGRIAVPGYISLEISGFKTQEDYCSA